MVVTPGELLSTDATRFLGGHGTYTTAVRRPRGGHDSGGSDAPTQLHLLASLLGRVARVNRLVTVEPLRARYVGEVGDVVVGRVTQVADGSHWNLDILAHNDGRLMLSAVSSGLIRRRDETGRSVAPSEIDMRSVFRENDVVAAEVQQYRSMENRVLLQTRSARYGRLSRGCLVRVPSTLVRRTRSHFWYYQEGEGEGSDPSDVPQMVVKVALGKNGYIWIGAAPRPAGAATTGADGSSSGPPVADMGTTSDLYASDALSGGAGGASGSGGSDGPSAKRDDDSADDAVPVSDALRRTIARVRSAILALAKCDIQVFPESIEDVLRAAREGGMSPAEMTQVWSKASNPDDPSSSPQSPVLLVCEAASDRIGRMNLEDAMAVMGGGDADGVQEEEFVFQVDSKSTGSSW